MMLLYIDSIKIIHIFLKNSNCPLMVINTNYKLARFVAGLDILNRYYTIIPLFRTLIFLLPSFPDKKS